MNEIESLQADIQMLRIINGVLLLISVYLLWYLSRIKIHIAKSDFKVFEYRTSVQLWKEKVDDLNRENEKLRRIVPKRKAMKATMK